MSKYFSDDTPLTDQLEFQIEDNNYVIPTPPHVDTSLREKKIQQEATIAVEKPKSVEEHIAVVNHQNKTVNNVMREITAGTAEEITNTFESLSTLELFERMNQISFLLVKMNSRLDSIEQTIKSTDTNNQQAQEYAKIETAPTVETIVSKPDYQEANTNVIGTSKLTPQEQYALKTTDKLTTLESAHKQLADGMNGKLPDEGYLGEGTNLEKIFPNMPTEAYQSAYESINDIRNK